MIRELKLVLLKVTVHLICAKQCKTVLLLPVLVTKVSAHCWWQLSRTM